MSLKSNLPGIYKIRVSETANACGQRYIVHSASARSGLELLRVTGEGCGDIVVYLVKQLIVGVFQQLSACTVFETELLLMSLHHRVY